MISKLRLTRVNCDFKLTQIRQNNFLDRFAFSCFDDKRSHNTIISQYRCEQIRPFSVTTNPLMANSTKLVRSLFFDRLQFNSTKKVEEQVKDPFTFEIKTKPTPPPPPPPPPPPSAKEIAKMSLWERYKKMFREYWYVLVPVHLVTSTVWFGVFYYMAISGVDIIAILKAVGASEQILQKLEHSGAGYFAIAYALYKIATPARYTVTLGGTTISVKYLAAWGLIKPAPSPAQFHQFLRVKGQLLFRRRRIRSKGRILERKKKKNVN